ncbi:hypothetical protein SAMN05216388_1005137 [Halorientalis persicus]|jgi:hypothetical protein|uniref:Uncharacterized protein n=1 Tax=Halorientalis persicus TaxID=1367881 RepID=A0A1H8JP34_9EURY|nr:hypothetical protein [Halorientalis persicus]SEN82442.1 hypothetical protein SAMN05216388_1005137 [Halorientalis persicus]
MPTRRSVLVSTGALVTAGCSSRNDTDSDGSDSSDGEAFDNTILDERGGTKLQPGTHAAFDFTYEGTKSVQIAYDLTVVDDWDIDVLVLDGENYDRYPDGGHLSYSAELSAIETDEVQNEGYVSAGRYAIVFDNTDRFTEPTDIPVPIEFDVEVATN